MAWQKGKIRGSQLKHSGVSEQVEHRYLGVERARFVVANFRNNPAIRAIRLEWRMPMANLLGPDSFRGSSTYCGTG